MLVSENWLEKPIRKIKSTFDTRDPETNIALGAMFVSVMYIPYYWRLPDPPIHLTFPKIASIGSMSRFDDKAWAKTTSLLSPAFSGTVFRKSVGPESGTLSSELKDVVVDLSGISMTKLPFLFKEDSSYSNSLNSGCGIIAWICLGSRNQMDTINTWNRWKIKVFLNQCITVIFRERFQVEYWRKRWLTSPRGFLPQMMVVV